MIAATQLGKRYGARWLFRHLDFEVQPGECLLITGTNGSGKSTLLRALAGLLPLDEGQVQREGEIGVAALDQAVYPQLTVREHLELAADLRGTEPRADELLARVGLLNAAEQEARTLSTGMRARLRFALAFQHEPNVVLLDEPGAALDEAGQGLIDAWIEEVRPHAALIIATNDAAERRWGTHELRLGA